MIKNYLKVALRNLTRNKFYTLINISGLAVGLAAFVVILLYLNYELSYDTWNPALKKVYKISVQTDEDILPQTPAPLASFLLQNSPDIEYATSIMPSGKFEALLDADGKKIFQSGGVSADSLFFKVFPYKIIAGSAPTILDKPNAIVISHDLSKKLFGNMNPVGKTIKLYNAFENEITGIMQMPDKPSELNVQFIFRAPYEKQNMFWENFSFETYIKTKNKISTGKLEDDINRIFYNARLKKDNLSLNDFRKAGHQAGLFADPIQNLHNFPKHGSSSFTTVSILLILAALLLLAGAINFSNLSIASSMRRAKEIGVRKVLGSGRKQLFWQFMSEIALQCFLSLCLAVLLVGIILPYFNKEFDINLNFFHSANVLSISSQIILCLLMVIILSGMYPALFLSRYNITKVLKGDYSTGKKGAGFRNALIVLQFSVSAFFIIGTLVISRQMDYMQTKDKGFSGKQVMRLEATQDTRDANFDITKNILLSIPGVQYVSKTTTVPGDAVTDTSTQAYKYKGKEYRMVSVKVSDDYFKTLDIALLQGRFFNNSYADENTRTAVINEAAAKKLNAPNPVGAYITFPHCDSVPVQVIGIVKNFNVAGLEKAVQPVVFTVGNKACMFQSGGAILVKLSSNNISKTVADIERVWKKAEPDFPIRYSFLDENFQKLFASYQRLRVIINFFALIAILISMMGLFALTTFLVNRRTKEIGIRKILGAGVNDLWILLNKDFIRLILIAMLIAIPLGWWASAKWLQNFAYRISVNWVIIAMAGISIIVIAVATMSIQAIKAAMANPVKSLRSE